MIARDPKLQTFLDLTEEAIVAAIGTHEARPAASSQASARKRVRETTRRPKLAGPRRAARAPLDAVGTGSFLPATLTEIYATADIIAYDGARRVKIGREFLFDQS